METEKMISSINRIAWSSIFLFLDVNINGVSLLPAFAGYLMILSAIDGLAPRIREITLLKPLATMLAFWYGLIWILSFAGVQLENFLSVVSLLMTVVSVYFYFQLMSDIALIAKEVQTEGTETDRRILKWRNVQLILTTASSMFVYFTGVGPLSGVLGVIAIFIVLGMVISCIGIILALFELRNQIKNES